MLFENRNHADKSLANQQSKTNKIKKEDSVLILLIRNDRDTSPEASDDDMLSTQEGEVEDGDFKVIFSS